METWETVLLTAGIKVWGNRTLLLSNITDTHCLQCNCLTSRLCFVYQTVFFGGGVPHIPQKKMLACEKGWVTLNADLYSIKQMNHFSPPVRPDPPVSLNWTLLNISPSGLSYDVIVNWEPPPSADVKAGWMRLEYEIQYRERNSTNWEAVSHRYINPPPP